VKTRHKPDQDSLQDLRHHPRVWVTNTRCRCVAAASRTVLCSAASKPACSAACNP